MEFMPESQIKRFEEKQPEKEEEFKERVRAILDRFLSLPDEPGKFLSAKEKLELIEKAQRGDKQALKELEENKQSKYRVNSLYGPLGIIQLFLDSPESRDIPEEKKKELSLRVDKAIIDIKEVRKGLISEKEVKETVDIVNEVKTLL